MFEMDPHHEVRRGPRVVPGAVGDDTIELALVVLGDAGRRTLLIRAGEADHRRAAVLTAIGTALRGSRRALLRAGRLPEQSAERRSEMDTALVHARYARHEIERLRRGGLRSVPTTVRRGATARAPHARDGRPEARRRGGSPG